MILQRILFMILGSLIGSAIVLIPTYIIAPWVNKKFTKLQNEAKENCIKTMCELFDEQYQSWIKLNESEIIAKKLIGEETAYEFRVRRKDISGCCSSKFQEYDFIITLKEKLIDYINDKGLIVEDIKTLSYIIVDKKLKNPTVIKIFVRV